MEGGKMPKKHFKAIAEIFKTTRAVKEVAEVALKLCDVFQQDNPRFDKEKFLRDCGF